MKRKANFYHYTLYDKNFPVASLTLSLNKDIVRIDDVGTEPKYQKKGYATKLVLYALSKAKELGASSCFLEASNEGLSLYKKIGFKKLFNNLIFSFE